MNSSSSSVTLTTDPAWPWSITSIGLPALLVVALLLVALTVWTYVGARGTTPRRLLLVIALRLLALLLAVLALLRPSVAFRDEQRFPSKIILVLDYSESMTIKDEYNDQSRWAVLQRTLQEDCQQALQLLRSEHNVEVVIYQFAGDVRGYEPQSQPDGPRTDHGQMLDRLLKDHGHERNLRALIILGDGADNGTRIQPLPLAAQWRNLPCPIYTVPFGRTTTSDQQNDIRLTAITVEPSPAVPVKGEMIVKATVDAPGFANVPVNLQLLIDDKPVNVERVFINDQDVTNDKQKQLPLTQGNGVRLKCSAPPKPGEVKVTLRVEPLPGEVTDVNNEISTFVTVAKEGISVLLVDKGRFWEPKFLARALSRDPRIRLHSVLLRRDEALAPEQIDLFQFDKQHYDVIILGDVSARRLLQGNPQALAKIKELVDKRGTGLLAMGGYDSFANSDWRGTDLERILPVQLNDPGQVERQVRLEPTEAGLRHFILRLADKAEENAAIWKRLPPLDGMTLLGTPKVGAILYAKSNLDKPLLVGQDYGAGRVLAFGGDTTHRWTRDPEGLYAHSQFWKHLVLWLAKQEEAEGNAWVKLDTRRLPSGSQVGFAVGLRGKGDVPIPDARFEVKVIGPDGTEMSAETARDKNEERGTFFKTDTPGEYRMVVKAKGKDSEGHETSGEAVGRFLVYQDTAELSVRRADHEFLKKLASTGGGEFLQPDKLPEFLEKLRTQPLPQNRPRTAVWPEWRKNSLSGFVVAYFVLFVALLALEWFLRRRWGMV